MSQANNRIALLFSDGSLLVLPAETGVEAARKEAEEHDSNDRTTQLVRISITEINQI